MSAKESQSKPVPRHSLLVDEEDANPTNSSSKTRENVWREGPSSGMKFPCLLNHSLWLLSGQDRISFISPSANGPHI